jgi:hypothetical protein
MNAPMLSGRAVKREAALAKSGRAESVHCHPPALEGFHSLDEALIGLWDSAAEVGHESEHRKTLVSGRAGRTWCAACGSCQMPHVYTECILNAAPASNRASVNGPNAATT